MRDWPTNRTSENRTDEPRPLEEGIRADFWEGDATKHFSVKKRDFQ